MLAAVDEAAEEAKASRLGWNKQNPHTTKQHEPNFKVGVDCSYSIGTDSIFCTSLSLLGGA